MNNTQLKKIKIYPVSTKDIDPVVAIHLQGFPNFFLTKMGPSFLRDYYSSVLRHPLHLFLMARVDDKPVGFVCGFGESSEFYRHYTSRLRTPLLAAWGLIKRPFLLPGILGNFRRLVIEKQNSNGVELSSICVLPETSGRGAGRQLLCSFVEVAGKLGFESVYLTVDAENNDRVNRFYITAGFYLESRVLRGKRPMNHFRLNLCSDGYDKPNLHL